MFNFNIPHDIYYIAFALLLAFFMIVLIPNGERRHLLGFSLIWGYLGSFIFVEIFGVFLNMFEWQTSPFTFGGSPLLLNLAWAPALMIYLYFLPKEKHMFWLYLVTLSLVSAGIDSSFNKLGSLEYNQWSPVWRFIVAIVWFLAATLHYNYVTRGKASIYSE